MRKTAFLLALVIALQAVLPANVNAAEIKDESVVATETNEETDVEIADTEEQAEVVEEEYNLAEVLNATEEEKSGLVTYYYPSYHKAATCTVNGVETSGWFVAVQSDIYQEEVADIIDGGLTKDAVISDIKVYIDGSSTATTLNNTSTNKYVVNGTERKCLEVYYSGFFPAGKMSEGPHALKMQFTVTEGGKSKTFCTNWFQSLFEDAFNFSKYEYPPKGYQTRVIANKRAKLQSVSLPDLYTTSPNGKIVKAYIRSTKTREIVPGSETTLDISAYTSKYAYQAYYYQYCEVDNVTDYWSSPSNHIYYSPVMPKDAYKFGFKAVEFGKMTLPEGDYDLVFVDNAGKTYAQQKYYKAVTYTYVSGVSTVANGYFSHDWNSNYIALRVYGYNLTKELAPTILGSASTDGEVYDYTLLSTQPVGDSQRGQEVAYYLLKYNKAGSKLTGKEKVSFNSDLLRDFKGDETDANSFKCTLSHTYNKPIYRYGFYNAGKLSMIRVYLSSAYVKEGDSVNVCELYDAYPPKEGTYKSYTVKKNIVDELYIEIPSTDDIFKNIRDQKKINYYTANSIRVVAGGTKQDVRIYYKYQSYTGGTEVIYGVDGDPSYMKDAVLSDEIVVPAGYSYRISAISQMGQALYAGTAQTTGNVVTADMLKVLAAYGELRINIYDENGEVYDQYPQVMITQSDGSANLPTPPVVEDENLEGDSNNVHWSIKNGVLTITGTGDWERDASGNAPWYKHRSKVKKAVVNLAGATNLSQMLYEMSIMTSADVKGVDTSAATECSKMFTNCSKLETIDMSSWNLTSCTKASSMLDGCGNLQLVKTPKNLNVNVYFDTNNKDYFADKDDDKYSALPKGRADSVILYRTSNVNVRYGKDDPVYFDLKVSNSYFEDGTSYNHELARFASKMSMLCYSRGGQEMNSALDSLGYNDYEYHRFGKLIYKKESNNVTVNHYDDNLYDTYKVQYNGELSPYWIAHKHCTLEDGEYTLLSVCIMGTDDNDEWIDNFDSGTGDTHKGFLRTAKVIARDLKEYIKDNDIDENKIKVFVTGHSRGAAVANLVGAILDNPSLYSGVERIEANKSDIFVYTFATPNATSKKVRQDASYENIFNVVNPEDFVTKVLPSDWGYGRFGKTLVLPNKVTDSYEYYYQNFLPKLGEFYSKYSNGDVYKPYFYGMETVTDYVIKVTNQVENIDEYYTLSLNNKDRFYTLKNLYTYTMGYSQADNGYDDVVTENAFLAAVGTYGSVGQSTAVFLALHAIQVEQKVVDFLESNGLLKEKLKSNRDDFKKAHAIITYAAAMDAITERQLFEKRKALYGVVNCPVDITVYSGDEVVGQIVNNKVIEDKTDITMSVDGDSKRFYLPQSGDYRVELTGNDNGVMDYSLCEVDPDTGEISRVFYNDVALKNGVGKESKYVQEITADTEISNYKLKNLSDESIAPTAVLDEDELGELTVFIEAEGPGVAKNIGNLSPGDYVTLMVSPEEYGIFRGWYDDKGNLLTMDDDYSFSISENMSFTAKYDEVPKIALPKDELTLSIYPKKKDFAGNNIITLVPQLRSTDINQKIVWTVEAEGEDVDVVPGKNGKAGSKYLSASNGKLTAKKTGVGKTVIVTAWLKEGKNLTASAKCRVKIIDNEDYRLPNTRLEANKTTYDINVNAKGMKASKTKANKGILLSASGLTALSTNKIKWSSSDNKVATVTGTGKVVGKKEGTAYITAKLGDEVVEYTVNVHAAGITLNTNAAEYDKKKKAYSMGLGETADMSWWIKSVSGTTPISSAVTWSIPSASHKKLATVDENGILTCGSKKGSITVNAEINGIYIPIKVNIK